MPPDEELDNVYNFLEAVKSSVLYSLSLSLSLSLNWQLGQLANNMLNDQLKKVMY